MTLFFAAKVQGVGAVACAATNPMQFLAYRFSSVEQCQKFLDSVRDTGAMLHTGMAHSELQAMVELWTAGRSPKRQPGSPLPLKAPYLRADEVTRELPDEGFDVGRELRVNKPKLTLRGEPLDIVDRYKAVAEAEDRIIARLDGKEVQVNSPEFVENVNRIHPGFIDHWLEKPLIESDDASDIHVPVRPALPPVPGILRSMAEVVNHEEPRRVWKAVDPSLRDEDFA